MKRGAVVLALALALTGSGAAGADDGLLAGDPVPAVVAGDPQDTYGTASLTAHQIGSYQFQSRDGSALGNPQGVARHLTVAGAALATPMLPNGAQVERVDLRACDSDAASQVSAGLSSCTSIGGLCSAAGAVLTGIAATPGCTVFSVAVTPPVIVDNANKVLAVSVGTGTTSATTFSAVLLYYRLRVSPAPATATFPNDVPTSHPFFRFIEALAAAGVTGGCGAGAYCPDAAVTRGQMAVFLATALGLHFPN